MILASLREGGRDGTLIVVSRERTRGVRAGGAWPTLQAALDDWAKARPELEAIGASLEAGRAAGDFPIDVDALTAPLRRALNYFDAACYPEHIVPIRKARGASLPDDFYDLPLMYQGCSNPMVGPTEPIRLPQDEAYGVDLEAEIVAITDDVPMGVGVADAPKHIVLLGLLNDISLRTLVGPELGRGFGFLQSKGVSSMGPFVITPDEAGDLWNGRFMSGRYLVEARGERIGELEAGDDAVYDYADLIHHACKTRELMAGSVIGAGTLANKDRSRGCGCIAEARAREQLTDGEPRTPYLKFGDDMRLELFDRQGRSVFGAIHQRLERA